jgi:hypothetical protein
VSACPCLPLRYRTPQRFAPRWGITPARRRLASTPSPAPILRGDTNDRLYLNSFRHAHFQALVHRRSRRPYPLQPRIMKIVIADDLPRSAVALLAEQPGWVVDNTPARPLPDLLAAMADADALVVRSATKVTRQVIDAAPKLRVIARAGTGVDNVDLAAASARGIVVMNAPGANSISVAELAMGQLLALARHLPGADAAMKAHKWEKKKFAGQELRGKTLGVVGLGRIGQAVACRARAFEMEIVAHDPFISEEDAGCLRDRRLRHAASAGDAADAPSCQRRTAGRGEERHPHHQHGARRVD